MTMLSATAAKPRPTIPAPRIPIFMSLPFEATFGPVSIANLADGRYKCEVHTIKSYTHQKVSFVKNKRKTKCKPDTDVLYRRCCGAKVQDALRPLEGRWKLMIMAQLLAGPAMRFSDLERALPQISQKMLIQRLRDLEEDGIVSRKLYPQVPPKVEYCLTEVGKGLRPVFIALLDWTELQRSTISIEEPPKA
jgi:DNA-binding HxlR family transcriptional regulator